MKKVNVLLSISSNNSFDYMIEKLRESCNFSICDINNVNLSGIDIFIGKRLEAKSLLNADKLKVIFAYKTGVEDFPLAKLKEKGITLVNSYADSTIIARYAFALALTLVNQISQNDFLLRKGIWRNKNVPYWADLFTLKVGLLGYGHIGQEIHKILKDNQIETYTLNRNKKYANILLVQSLEELINKTDILIVSLPNTKDTDMLFTKDLLQKMTGKYIVNVGRSNCFDEQELFLALKNKVLAGAALDTWSNKPNDLNKKQLPSQYHFEELDNVIMSPHCAMKVPNGHKNYVIDTTNNVLEYLAKGTLRNVVNLDKGY